MLWILKIGITELGYLLVVPLLLFSFISYRYKMKIVATISLIASLIYALPLISAYFISIPLKNHLTFTYGAANMAPTAPLSFSRLLNIGTNYTAQVRNEVYKTIKGQKLEVAIYSDGKPYLKPCVVAVHGGAWSSGDNTMFANFDTYMANKGYVVADVNYQLAPKAIFPAQEHDIMAAIAYLKAHAAEYQIDVNKIFLLGRSAGGQLAGVTAFHLGRSEIKGLICFYTPHDMVWGYSAPGNPMILDSRKVLSAYLGGSLYEASANFFAASPVHQVKDNIPPLLLIHGEGDEMVAYEHNMHLIEKIAKKSVPYYLLSIPFATHGCDYFFQSPSAQLSTFAIEHFLKSYSN